MHKIIDIFHGQKARYGDTFHEYELTDSSSLTKDEALSLFMEKPEISCLKPIPYDEYIRLIRLKQGDKDYDFGNNFKPHFDIKKKDNWLITIILPSCD